MATLSELASVCDGRIDSRDGDYEIKEVASLERATAQCIAPFYKQKYSGQITATQAGAIICRLQPVGFKGRILWVDNPQLALIKIAPLLYGQSQSAMGVHRSAVVAQDVIVPDDCYIGANAVVQSGAQIAAGVKIKAGSYIGAAASIGSNGCIGPNATVHAGCQLGDNVSIGSGSVVGSDGFGYVPSDAPDAPYWAKALQVGHVVMGNNVRVGANTTIDRGSISHTIIGDDVIIDNLVQIAHNVTIGRATAIAACSGIAGSTHIGEHCLIGGRVGIVGHINICAKTTIYANSLVTKSITKPGIYSSSLPAQPLQLWQRMIVNLRRQARKDIVTKPEK